MTWQRYEIVRGELLVSPAPPPRHPVIIARLSAMLRDYLEPHGLADQLIMAAADITIASDTVVQPDLFVAEMAAGIASGKWSDVTTLFLVVEVASPSSVRADRQLKRPEYQQYGIPQYWIVDGDQRHIEVWTPGAEAPVIERERLPWRHPMLADECVVDLVRLFDFG